MSGGHLGRRVTESIGWSAVAGVGLVMITQAFGWDGFVLVATLQSFTPYGIPLVVIAAGAAVWLERDGLGVTAACVGLGALVLCAPIVFPPGRPEVRPDAVGVSAAAVNLLFSNSQVDEVADDLLELDADVIVFSEYTPEHRSTLAAHPVARRYPDKVDRDSLFAGGVAVWSKYPLSENERIDSINGMIDASLDGPDGPIRILAVHPPTPVFDHDEWRRELLLIGESADDIGFPTLVIGDFNASYWHPAFRDLLRRGLTDAHIVAGRGWSTSWPTGELFPPFVRLDHALTGHGLVSTEVDDFRVPGSDHAAFVVTVKPAVD
jgi:endonuclease/exonuclease/phosphatase (EEP) superfamily protein YafD